MGLIVPSTRVHSASPHKVLNALKAAGFSSGEGVPHSHGWNVSFQRKRHSKGHWGYDRVHQMVFRRAQGPDLIFDSVPFPENARRNDYAVAGDRLEERLELFRKAGVITPEMENSALESLATQAKTFGVYRLRLLFTPVVYGDAAYRKLLRLGAR